MRINFNYLSKYRNALLGMAIIEIVIFHYCADCVTTVPYLGSQIVLKLAKVYVSVLGSVGVDFFVLLSGIGLYYSFSQNSDIKEFYRKRFNRIIPTYLFLGGILWLIRDIFVMGEPFSTFFRDLTMVSFWCEGNTLVWYSIPERYFGNAHVKQTKAAKYLIKNHGLRMIALHDDMKDELDRIFGINNTITIKNGIDLNKYKISETKQEIRDALGIPREAFVVGNVGRFIEIKNHLFLIDIFNEIKKINMAAHLLLIGDGQLREAIQNKIQLLKLSDSVTILSHRDDVPRLMKAMDVFIFPSKVEGFGIVTIEAQAAGLRCLISEAVPSSAYVSELAIPMSLNATADEWANVALDRNAASNYQNRIVEYDMNREIKKLEKLYLS